MGEDINEDYPLHARVLRASPLKHTNLQTGHFIAYFSEDPSVRLQVYCPIGVDFPIGRDVSVYVRPKSGRTVNYGGRLNRTFTSYFATLLSTDLIDTSSVEPENVALFGPISSYSISREDFIKIYMQRIFRVLHVSMDGDRFVGKSLFITPPPGDAKLLRRATSDSLRVIVEGYLAYSVSSGDYPYAVLFDPLQVSEGEIRDTISKSGKTPLRLAENKPL